MGDFRRHLKRCLQDPVLKAEWDAQAVEREKDRSDALTTLDEYLRKSGIIDEQMADAHKETKPASMPTICARHVRQLVTNVWHSCSGLLARVCSRS